MAGNAAIPAIHFWESDWLSGKKLPSDWFIAKNFYLLAINGPKRGKICTRESRLVLGLLLIGGESSACL